MYPLNATTKLSIRSQAAKRRKELPAEYRSESSRAICEYLEDHPPLQCATSIAGYRAYGSEASVEGFLRSIMTQRKRLYLPRVREDNSLDLCLVEDLQVQCLPGAFGVLEPIGPAEPDLSVIGAILVPGVAFDERGHRIGHGAGFYDRLLCRLDDQTYRIGVAFECQVYSTIPYDARDQDVHCLVTEKGWRFH